ncbi:flagellar biosynthesis repressor FlbT [Methylocapsa acidiphila]|uniref:flagellar biosynthesis repressor FlbT n=1 Tax=Methylocapsa acidiphila TaxID=133552 RepID=UPI0004045948|nr:flagellar biosynthesis repressor FlbT [Methylocapsa acidiphila]
MYISLRAGEKVYINGAVLRAQRKVSLELLNDATFLLEAHVMKVEDATTPLRQLYFIVQIMLMNPTDSTSARDMFNQSIKLIIDVTSDNEFRCGLFTIKDLVRSNRVFDALRAIRGLFAAEGEILNGDRRPSSIHAA